MTVKIDKRKKKQAAMCEVTSERYKDFQQVATQTVPYYYGYNLYRHPHHCAQEWGLDDDGKRFDGWYALRNTKTGSLVSCAPDAHVLTERYLSSTITSEIQVFRNNHLIMTREWGMASWGSAYNGMWVVRDIRDGRYIDGSIYSNDLIEKYLFISEYEAAEREAASEQKEEK